MVRRSRFSTLAQCLAAIAAVPAAADAGGVPGVGLGEVTVTAARRGELLGQSDSASEGTVLGDQLVTRPLLRTGEVLEVVPGLIVTQHSGDGKANQYFLRGFNLDHGTDFSARVEGMPVNMPTHAHGQGYSDINFLIPELIERIEYRKGTYYAAEGNFSAAGAVDIGYERALDKSFAVLSAGADDFGRALFAMSPSLGNGNLLLAVDGSYTDGPWDLAEHFHKLIGLAKYTHGDEDDGFNVELMGYDGQWRSTDQIPLRAVEDGSIDRFGNIDPTDGGETHRYSLSGAWWGRVGPGRLRASAYGIDYKLDLFSNFTYATDTEHGDQFEQFDDRRVYGLDTSYEQPLALFGREGRFTAGVEVRRDDIAPVGLYRTVARERFETVRQDNVVQTSYSAYVSQGLHVTDWLRAEAGLRFDTYQFRVRSNLAANSGDASDSITSPKLTLVFGPWAKTELFANWGQGYHSNDARGATITVDPTDGVTPAERVTPLVKAVGGEIGARTAIVPKLQLAASLWTLKIDSELLFSGDGGTTEPSRASRRTGLELSAYYTPTKSITVDADVAWSHARFTDDDPAGDRIPNAVEQVISVGFTYQTKDRWFAGARLRYLGAAPLIEDNRVRSKPTTLLNVDVGYHFTPNISASLTLLNAFDEKANDITYYYESQLAGEVAPVADLHLHPAEPREVRVALKATF